MSASQAKENASSTGWTIAKWCIGLAVIAVVGLPVGIIMLLVVVAAIGASANNEYEATEVTTPITQISQPAVIDSDDITVPSVEEQTFE